MLLVPQTKTAFLLVLNSIERQFLLSPAVFKMFYGHIVARTPEIHHVVVVDDPAFQFIYENDDTQLLNYS